MLKELTFFYDGLGKMVYISFRKNVNYVSFSQYSIKINYLIPWKYFVRQWYFLLVSSQDLPTLDCYKIDLKNTCRTWHGFKREWFFGSTLMRLTMMDLVRNVRWSFQITSRCTTPLRQTLASQENPSLSMLLLLPLFFLFPCPLPMP